mmetsp:Transcript_15052/g.32856  ORF Transcript_15052/g.32856 Transcript_15052/m.32856 type:complete len:222 (-) Transcript_15052:1274-1939(-)
MLSRRSVTSDPLGVTVLSPPPTPSFDFSSSVNATGSAGARIGSFWLRALQTSLPNGCAFFSDFNLAVFNRRSVCSFSACFTALLCPCTSFAWCRNCLCKRRSFSAVCSALTRFCLFRWARVSFSFRLMIFVAFAELPSLSSSSSSLDSSSSDDSSSSSSSSSSPPNALGRAPHVFFPMALPSLVIIPPAPAADARPYRSSPPSSSVSPEFGYSGIPNGSPP